jgi:hypothetical protein
MTKGRFLAVILALGAGGALSLACSPQVVDAVDPGPEGTAGTGATGGTSGGGGTSGSGVGGDTTTGGAPVCPVGSMGDLDGDGFLDCNDGCPEDPNKSVPGTCGCGLPNPADVGEGEASCNDLIALLAHRYTFEGPANSIRVVDSQAGAEYDGEVQRTTLSGEGTLDLAGSRSDQWVGLRNGLLQESPSITLEAWVRWNGGNNWQRIFDFGSNNSPAGEGEQGDNGTTYLFLTARTPNDPVAPQLLQTGKMRLAYKRGAGELELTAEAPVALPSGGMEFTHVAVVVDSENMKMSIYMNGEPQNGYAFVSGFIDTVPPIEHIEPIVVSTAGPYDWSTPLADGTMPPPVDLSTIVDHNNWLGRSQFVADDSFGGTYDEFRIYAGALTAEQIGISFKAGPNPVFFN